MDVLMCKLITQTPERNESVVRLGVFIFLACKKYFPRHVENITVRPDKH